MKLLNVTAVVLHFLLVRQPQQTTSVVQRDCLHTMRQFPVLDITLP